MHVRGSTTAPHTDRVDWPRGHAVPRRCDTFALACLEFHRVHSGHPNTSPLSPLSGRCRNSRSRTQKRCTSSRKHGRCCRTRMASPSSKRSALSGGSKRRASKTASLRRNEQTLTTRSPKRQIGSRPWRSRFGTSRTCGVATIACIASCARPCASYHVGAGFYFGPLVAVADRCTTPVCCAALCRYGTHQYAVAANDALGTDAMEHLGHVELARGENLIEVCIVQATITAEGKHAFGNVTPTSFFTYVVPHLTLCRSSYRATRHRAALCSPMGARMCQTASIASDGVWSKSRSSAGLITASTFDGFKV